MKVIRIIAALVLTAGLSACASGEIASRNVQIASTPVEAAATSFDVRDVNVTVPRTLKVSEANLYLPAGDIVWREDPKGDRHAQVQAIVDAAMRQGTAGMQGRMPVRVDVEITRFHALTEKARYTVGGVHAIQFNLTLADPETGVPLTRPRHVKANLKAFGGKKALDAEAQGLTQKVRITQHLAGVIQQELANPAAFEPAAQPLFVAAN